VTPPRSRPTKTMIVELKMKKMPIQSMALMPVKIGVLGLCTSRNINRTMEVKPAIGLDCYYGSRNGG
jgi:hypothetical protein